MAELDDAAEELALKLKELEHEAQEGAETIQSFGEKLDAVTSRGVVEFVLDTVRVSGLVRGHDAGRRAVVGSAVFLPGRAVSADMDVSER